MAATLQVSELVQFLDTAGKKGWIKKSTASGMKSSCERVLGSLDREEQADVRSIDVDAAIRRFANLHNEVSAASLRVYESRIRSAISQFIASRDNPKSWQTQRAKQGKGSTFLAGKSVPTSSRLTKRRPHDAAASGTEPTAAGDDGPLPEQGLSYPFPLRSDVTILISNIPRDLRVAEVDRVSQFLKALALGDNSA